LLDRFKNMLQRIQSIYLLLAGVAILALFLFPMAHNVYVDNKPISIMATGVYQDVNGQQQLTDHFVALTAVTAIVGIVPLIIIFLYKKRKQQIALCYSAILVIIGYSFWLAQAAKEVTGGVTLELKNFGIGLFLCPIAILLLILSIKGIQRDEKLVKSADRLR
jgi:hypothetical protein